MRVSMSGGAGCGDPAGRATTPLPTPCLSSPKRNEKIRCPQCCGQHRRAGLHFIPRHVRLTLHMLCQRVVLDLPDYKGRTAPLGSSPLSNPSSRSLGRKLSPTNRRNLLAGPSPRDVTGGSTSDVIISYWHPRHRSPQSSSRRQVDTPCPPRSNETAIESTP